MTTPSDTRSSKEKVLQIYPDAKAEHWGGWRDGEEGINIKIGDARSGSGLATIGSGENDAAAWKDAASRLPVVEKRCPNCGDPEGHDIGHYCPAPVVCRICGDPLSLNCQCAELQNHAAEHPQDAADMLAAVMEGVAESEPKGLHGKHCDAYMVQEGRICDKPATVCQGRKYRCDEHDPYTPNPQAAPLPEERRTLDVERAQKWLKDHAYEQGGRFDLSSRVLAEIMHDYSLDCLAATPNEWAGIAGTNAAGEILERERADALQQRVDEAVELFERLEGILRMYGSFAIRDQVTQMIAKLTAKEGCP